MIVKHYARIPGSPTKGEDRVRITSVCHYNPEFVYVSRLVKSTDRWGKKRWYIKRSDIRSIHDFSSREMDDIIEQVFTQGMIA